MLARTAMSAMFLALPALADEAAPRTVAIGDLALSFDASAWSIEGGGGRYLIRQTGGKPDEAVAIEVTGDGQGCTPAAMEEIGRLAYPDALARRWTTIRRPGFDLHVATLDMGCRNWTGSPVFACTVFRDKGYFITADPGGCATPPNYDRSVGDLLAGLAAP
jgi:hypothetical protein